jgi:hypothetical protein
VKEMQLDDLDREREKRRQVEAVAEELTELR